MTPQEYNSSVDNYSDRIYRFVLKSLGDQERAKDVVQDSYEKLWMNVTDIDYSKAKAWLFSTAYNTMVDVIRKDKKLVIGSQPDSEDLNYSKGYTDLNEILHNYLGKLPDKWKSVLLLRDYEGYSYSEISKITGQTEAQVKINIYRGRMALRKMIGKIEILI